MKTLLQALGAVIEALLDLLSRVPPRPGRR